MSWQSADRRQAQHSGMFCMLNPPLQLQLKASGAERVCVPASLRLFRRSCQHAEAGAAPEECASLATLPQHLPGGVAGS